MANALHQITSAILAHGQTFKYALRVAPRTIRKVAEMTLNKFEEARPVLLEGSLHSIQVYVHVLHSKLRNQSLAFILLAVRLQSLFARNTQAFRLV